MEIADFIKNVAAQYEETDTCEFNANTRFKEKDEWSSLTAMAIIAMVDEVYKVKLLGEEIRKSSTINDIFDIVKSRT